MELIDTNYRFWTLKARIPCLKCGDILDRAQIRFLIPKDRPEEYAWDITLLYHSNKVWSQDCCLPGADPDLADLQLTFRKIKSTKAADS